MRYYVVVTLAIFGLVTGLILYSPVSFVTGEDMEEGLALIVVSDYAGGCHSETQKGIDFYDHLIQKGYGHGDIVLLAPTGVPNRDNSPTKTNIVSALQDIADDTDDEKEVVIWISDHIGAETNSTFFRFTDGNLATSDMDDELDEIECGDMTVIIGGSYSGLAGPDLYETGRTIITSMDDDQDYTPDLFDIARGLRTPSADSNDNGIISFREAYASEVSQISWSGQYPMIWED
ncbi:MAG: hypothetical protein ACMUIG_05305 [Thermoplasmatota archaeon]